MNQLDVLENFKQKAQEHTIAVAAVANNASAWENMDQKE